MGLGEASRLCTENLPTKSARLGELRDWLEHLLSESIPRLHINGQGVDRLPNTSSLTFSGIDADALLLNLPNTMMGTGSACASGAIAPSHVLQAIGLSRDDAFATIRASLGRFTDQDQIRQAALEIVESWRTLCLAS